MCYIFMALSHYKVKYSGQLYWAINLYLAFRNVFRLLDLEDTRGTFDPPEGWQFFVILQVVASINHIYLMFMCFKGNKLTVFIGWLLLWWFCICIV